MRSRPPRRAAADTSSLDGRRRTPARRSRRPPPPRAAAPLALLADLHPEQLRVAEWRVALLARRRERGGEGRVAGGTPAPHLAGALGAAIRQLGLDLLEPALREAAGEAE